MSLLDNSPGYEECTVFLEIAEFDEDGNILTRRSPVGIDAVARFQVQGQSGTSSRRAEQDAEGFETEKVYKVRFPRSFPYDLGAQSQIEWRGKRWSVFGDAAVYGASPKTAHLAYTIKRY